MKKSTPPAAAAAHVVTVVGIDLAKNAFALHGIDAAGKPCLVHRLSRLSRLRAERAERAEGHERAEERAEGQV